MASLDKVFVTAKVENVSDLLNAERELIKPEQVRSLDVTDVLASTEVLPLLLPKRLITRLGLYPMRTQKAITNDGSVTLQMYGTVRLTIQDRDWTGDVVDMPDDYPVVIGRLPLHGLDLVVDPEGQRLIGNPAHGGEHVIELY